MWLLLFFGRLVRKLGERLHKHLKSLSLGLPMVVAFLQELGPFDPILLAFRDLHR